MKNKEQLYAFYLPDHTRPVYDPGSVLYVGTKEELRVFAEGLQQASVSEYYGDFIDAICNHSDRLDADYVVAGKRFTHPIPVEEVGRKEFTLTDYVWQHQSDKYNSAYLMKADMVWISFIVIRVNGMLVRCDKVLFQCLGFSVPGLGWINWFKTAHSAPGLVHAEIESVETLRSTVWTMLHCFGREYSTSCSDADAVAELPGMMNPCLNAVMEQIWGMV